METVKVEIDKDADLYFKCPHCNGITYLTDAACFLKNLNVINVLEYIN